MTASRLAALLDQATPGRRKGSDSWEWDDATLRGKHNNAIFHPARTFTPREAVNHDADARLIALAPDLARLLVDTFGKYAHQFDDETLARFAALDEKAGGR